MQSAIATLPWVEKDTIQTDAAKKQVKFTVTDAKLFDGKAVIEALNAKGAKYGSGASKLSGPSEAKKDESKTN